jgi:hypothetical protein
MQQIGDSGGLTAHLQGDAGRWDGAEVPVQFGAGEAELAAAGDVAGPVEGAPVQFRIAEIEADGDRRDGGRGGGMSRKAGIEKMGVTQVVESAAELFGKGQLYSASFGLLGRWLRYDGEQIRAIREKLKDRRLVVLIDDLDRCAPELLPQLLLSLRELLDLPGFTFVLAFDDEVVAEALVAKNPAWSSGRDFLEKILDFSFHLPKVTDLQKERLALKALGQYCPFVPPDSAKAVLDLLPSNPRKLKSLIRSLASLGPQISRHDAGELNWVDIWLAQMLRLESHPFFARLLKDDTLESEAGAAHDLILEMSKSRWIDGEERDNNLSLKELIAEAGVEDVQKAQRIITLVEAIRARGSTTFRYAAELTARPHAVTWKEFRAVEKSWRSSRQAPALLEFITAHSASRAYSPNDVEEELFGAILTKRDTLLEMAADTMAIPEHDSLCQDAGLLLQMLEQFLLDLRKLSPSRFKKVYGQCSHWIAFATNPGDKALRGQEEALLIRLLAEAPQELARGLLEELSPWSSFDDDFGDEQRVVDLKHALRTKCVGVIISKVAKDAIESLSREGAVRELFEQGRFVGYKYCLFNRQSPVWTTDLQNDLVEVIRTGASDHIVYQNVHHFLHIILQAARSGFDHVTQSDITTLLSREEFVRTLWQTITSREIQYRKQHGIISARGTLIKLGVSESLLPLTSELKSRLEIDKSRSTSNPSVPVQESEPTEPDPPPDL